MATVIVLTIATIVGFGLIPYFFAIACMSRSMWQFYYAALPALAVVFVVATGGVVLVRPAVKSVVIAVIGALSLPTALLFFVSSIRPILTEGEGWGGPILATVVVDVASVGALIGYVARRRWEEDF